MSTQRFVPIADPYDMSATLRVLQHGAYDPTVRVSHAVVWRAIRNTSGSATIRYSRAEGGVNVTAWGEGAEQALDDAPDVLGANDDPGAFRPAHELLGDLARRFAGIRLPRSKEIFEPLIPAIIEQKVTSIEATNSYAALVRKLGESAPGPCGLTLPVAPATIASLPYYAFHPLGIERRRADVMRHACQRETRLNEALSMSAIEARARLQAIEGIGPWTSAEVTRISHGDPDAVSVGDFHIPNMVAWALIGEARADDARMLELLAPFTGQRARVVRLLEAAGFRAPAFGPRHRVRAIKQL